MNDYDVFKDGWESENTVCGWGSQMEHTKQIRSSLPLILDLFDINTVNDAGCGDFWWMRNTDLSAVDYMGYDIHDRRNGYDFPFTKLDIVKEDMRPCDLIICRDVFIHLPNDMVLEALERFRRVGKYLLSTTYKIKDNSDRMEVPELKHSKINLCKEPFSLGAPREMIKEKSKGKYSLLWKL
jgi:hypothetical protein